MMAMFGGAKDCGNFLAAESHGKYPLPSSITHEGTLYNHYFTVPPTSEDALKCDFTTATSPDPISGEIDYFLSIGTASKYDGAGLRKLGGRPPVQLVFVLDVSGSMGGRFHSKDSKKMRGGVKIEKEKDQGTLLDAAKEALIGLLENMKEGDSFGLVSFCTKAQTEVDLGVWEGEKTRLEVIEKVKGIKLRGATDLTVGFNRAVKELDKEKFRDTKIIRRVMFLTDMNMTAGNSANLLSQMRKAAERPLPIHTTIIGFGFELDTDLCSTLSSVPFCNFFSVHSASEFLHQMTWEFDYLVFPIIQDLVVSVVGGEEGAGGVSVEKVCGSPDSLDAYPKGTVFGSKGLFASQTQGKDASECKGGVALVKVKLENPDKPLRLKTRFMTHEKKVVEVENEIVFPKWEEKAAQEEGQKWGIFGGEAVRKAVLLCRYVEFMKRFLEDVENREKTATITKSSGVVWKEELKGKGSTKGGAKVDKGAKIGCLGEYRERLQEFIEYYTFESGFLDDTGLGTWKAKMEQLLPEEKKEEKEEKEEKEVKRKARGAF